MNFKIRSVLLPKYINNTQSYLLGIIWLTTLFSINSGFYSVKNLFIYFDFSPRSLVDLINSLRWASPILILPFLIFFLKKRIKFDLFTVNIILITCAQIIYTFFLDREDTLFKVYGPQIVDNFSLLSAYLVTIVIYNFTINYNKKNILLLNQVLIFFLMFVSIFIFIKAINNIENIRELFLYYNDAFKPGKTYFDQPAPRVTGWSRIVLILFLIFFFYNEIEKKSKKIYYVNLFILFLICVVIILAQTRGSLIGLIFLSIFYLIVPNISLIKKFLILFLLIIGPILTVNALDDFTSKTLKTDQNRFKKTVESIFQEILIKDKNLIKDVDKDFDKNVDNEIITNTDSKKIIKSKKDYSVTSGRIQTWKSSIKIIIDNKKIIGYGPQGDRYVLSNIAKNHLEASWSNNSSNAIIYSILCFGIFGLISILLIYLSLFLIFIKSLKKIFSSKKNDFHLISSFVVFCYVILRSFFENSFAVFGLDYCILISSYFVIKLSLDNFSHS